MLPRDISEGAPVKTMSLFEKATIVLLFIVYVMGVLWLSGCSIGGQYGYSGEDSLHQTSPVKTATDRAGGCVESDPHKCPPINAEDTANAPTHFSNGSATY